MIAKDFQPLILTCLVTITRESHLSISGFNITGQGTQVKEQMLGATSAFSFLAFRGHDMFSVTLYPRAMELRVVYDTERPHLSCMWL